MDELKAEADRVDRMLWDESARIFRAGGGWEDVEQAEAKIEAKYLELEKEIVLRERNAKKGV